MPLIIAMVAVTVVPIAVAVNARSGQRHQAMQIDNHRPVRHAPRTPLLHGRAEASVLAALGATTQVNSFNLTYSIVETPPSNPSPSTTTNSGCNDTGSGYKFIPGSGGQAMTSCAMPTTDIHNSSLHGSGTVNIEPKAMVASAHIGGGTDVVVRLDSEHLWETIGDATPDLVPRDSAGNSAGGQSLSGFAGLTESTIGKRAGAAAMIAMASPNGYLVLDKQSIDGAAQIGTDTIDGIPVTTYEVGVETSRLLNLSGLSTDERTTLTNALGVMKDEGYRDTRVTVSVDNGGLIRRTVSVSSYDDGGSTTFDVTFSDLGCAGTVVMPGEDAPTPTTAACMVPPATTTTVASPTTTEVPPPSSSIPMPSAPATSIAVPPESTTADSTVPGSGTTTSTTSGPSHSP